MAGVFLPRSCRLIRPEYPIRFFITKHARRTLYAKIGRHDILIGAFREDGKTRDETAAKIRDKFALSEEEAAHYMDQFWTK